MKNIFKYGLALSTLLVLNSCDKELLNVEPKNGYTFYNFPKNEDQVNQAVVACYSRVRQLVNDRYWIWGEMYSDNTSFNYNPGDRGGVNTEQIDEHIYTTDNGAIKGFWDDTYDGILRSNFALEYLDKITFRSAIVKDTRIAEAKFWRAWHYFHLVQLFGDVPVVTKVITDPQEGRTYGRIPALEVYNNQIIPDLKEAVAKLPVKAEATGRLNKAAAEILLAKVYMVNKKFGDAVPLLESIQTQGYRLNAAYADNFDPLKKNSSEAIVEMQSDVTQAITFGFAPTLTPWGTGTTVFAGGSNSRGGLNQPTNEINALYEATDTRKAANIGSIDVSATRKGVLYLKKYIQFDITTKTNPVNFPLLRYADALLMYAECLNELGYGNTKAFDALNAIRKRAGVPEKKAEDLGSQDTFRKAVDLERRLELLGENHRWYDLLRTGQVDAVMKAHGLAEKKVKTTVVASGYLTPRPLLPISSYDVRQWGYPQNPGW